MGARVLGCSGARVLGCQPSAQRPLLNVQDQEIAPHTHDPQARGDLQALLQTSIDQFSAALGVPAGLVFEGRYAGKSTQQLSLLNSTVAQLASSTNEVLTKTYRALYGDDVSSGSEPPVLSLRTAPLAATDEVVSLYNAKLLPCEHAVSASLHALGVAPAAIDKAIEELCAKEHEETARQGEAVAQQKADAKISAEERKVNMEATKAQTEATKKQTAGTVQPAAASAGGS